MLILTRRPRQVVKVGDQIQVLVLDIVGDRVRLGITAPREIKVLRQEHRPLSGAPTPP
jgi:carbon storage regulator